MPNTTSPAPTFESIDIAFLTSVQGGCGKKQQCNCSAQAVAVAPPPAPMAPPPRPSVETSVDISYK